MVNEELRTNARKATSDVKPKLPLRGGLDRDGSLTGIDEVKTIIFLNKNRKNILPMA